ncbi:MAG: TolC family protein [Planctomycetota bacterium]|nr:MAG: TolC family protein [Planctomycetota bacterium]
MPEWTSLNFDRYAFSMCLRIIIVGSVGLAGCSSTQGREIESAIVSAPAGVNRRQQIEDTPAKTEDTKAPATRPAVVSDPLAQPQRINPKNIIHMVYELNPSVLASREEMVAAQYGLEEFKTNLSRFEPFMRVEGDVAEFPERRDSEGMTGEIVGGIEKETFEGAILRVEGGASGSRFEYGEVDEDQDEVEQGSGGLVRARFEIPFVGSRKRQNRVISQAFQESNAREAELDYLSRYRDYTESALSYYYTTLRYLNYARAYQQKHRDIEMLINDARCKTEDKLRLEAEVGETHVYIDQYHTLYRDSLARLLAYLGLYPDDKFILEEPPYKASPYLEMSKTPEGREKMTEEAYINNPKFQVLNNAIKDAQLQRDQAIIGKFDITAFVEGTQFAFGAETFDDRVGGWEIGAGLSVRLNDSRVLSASRLKAEAQIRQFRAEIEAERMKIRRQITTESDSLRSNHKIRLKVLENIKKTSAEFEERIKRYFNSGNVGNGGNGDTNPITIDDVLLSLSEKTSAMTLLAYYSSLVGDAESDLMAATGEVYRLVGMKIEDNGEMAFPEAKP